MILVIISRKTSFTLPVNDTGTHENGQCQNDINSIALKDKMTGFGNFYDWQEVCLRHLK